MAKNNATVQNPNQLAKDFSRVGGQLYKDATSPTAAKQQGANPDQAKMFGTKAQKEAVIKDKVAPAQVQQAPLGLTQQSQQQVDSQKEQADKFAKLGTDFNQRIRGSLNRIFGENLSTPAELKVEDGQVLNTYFAEDTEIDGKPVADYLQEYSNLIQSGADQQQAELPLIQLSQALQAEKGLYVSPEQIKGFYQNVESSIGQSAAERVQDNVFMSDFLQEDFADLGFESPQELADLVGLPLEEFNTLSFSEFQQAVENKRQEVFTEIQSLEQQLQTLPPGSQQAQEIKNQLRALGAAGAAVTEQEMQELVQNLDESDQLEIQGNVYTVEQILSDDNVSGIIANYFTKPADQREPFPPGFESLEQWINENEVLLTSLVSEMGDVAAGFEDTQKLVQSQANRELLTAIGIDPGTVGQVTTQQYQQIQDQIANDEKLQTVLAAPDNVTATLSQMIQQNPELYNNYSGSELVEGITELNKLAADTDVKAFFDQSTMDSGFLTPDQVDRARSIRATLDALETSGAKNLDEYDINKDAINNLIDQGIIIPGNADKVPALLEQFNGIRRQAEENAVVSPEVLNAAYTKLTEGMKKSALNQEQAAQREQLLGLDADQDGKITQQEIDTATTVPGFEDFFKNPETEMPADYADLASVQFSPVFDELLGLLDGPDDKLTEDESRKFLQDNIGTPELLTPEILSKLDENFNSVEDYETFQQEYKKQNDRVDRTIMRMKDNLMVAKNIGNPKQFKDALYRELRYGMYQVENFNYNAAQRLSAPKVMDFLKRQLDTIPSSELNPYKVKRIGPNKYKMYNFSESRWEVH